MAESDPNVNPPADPSITPPSPDLQLAPASLNGATTPPPDLVLPERSLVQEPRWPHPNFGWSLLWCVLFLIVTQVPGVVLIALILVGIATLSSLSILPPDTLRWDTLLNEEELYKSGAVNLSIAIGQFFTEVLVVGVPWLTIRIVVGRDWTRQVALRRPGQYHTLLALASVPAVVLMGNLSYQLLRESGWVPSISGSNPLHLVYFWTAVFVVLGAALLAARLLAGPGWTRRLAVRPTEPADILIATVIVSGLAFCIFLGTQGLRWAFPATSLDKVKLAGMDEMMELLGKWPLAFAVLVIGLGPGIGEELWCRGFLGRGLVGSYGAVLGVLATSFLFGLIHLDPCQGTMAMVMGLWLHFVYLSTRSLLLPMLLHFANNSVNVLETHVLPLKLMESKPQDIPLSVYVTMLLLFGSVTYALYQSRARLASKAGAEVIGWRPAFEGVEYPPSDSNVQVVHPLPSLVAAAVVGGSFLLFMLALTAWLSQGWHNGG